MKKFLMISAMAFSLLFAMPTWSHHAAEGIVSDDIWQMVDDLLGDAESPHLDLDLDSMGRPTLVVSFEVYDDEVDDFIAAINLEIDDLNRGASAIYITIRELGDGMTEIRIYEPIGSGESQDPPDMGS